MKWRVTYSSPAVGEKTLEFHSDNFTTASIDCFNIIRLMDPVEYSGFQYVQRVTKLEKVTS